MNQNTPALVSILVILAMSGCSEDIPTEFSATLSIDSPDDDSTVSVAPAPGAQLVSVEFTTNWTLRAKGECGSTDHCGHVSAFVDSSNCNAPGLDYNAVAVSSPMQVDLAHCATPLGQHTITLELRNDDETVVEDLLGDNVTDDVTVIAE